MSTAAAPADAPSTVSPTGHAPERGAHVGEADGVRRRVLVVEDEALIALDLERRLRRMGYDVVGIADCYEQAIELVQQHQPHLVLMDVFLIGPRDGIDAARAICARSDVPIVFVTANADGETVRRAAEVSPYGYLLKPFDDRTLAITVSVALKRHASETNERLLGAALRAASIGVVLVDVRGAAPRISFANESFLAMVGRALDEVMGQRPCFLSVDPADAVARRLVEGVEGRVAADGVLRTRHADGSVRWSSVSVSPVPTRTGDVSHMLVVHKDITEQRVAEAALSETQRLETVGHMTAGMAHDFNNVLSAIVAFAEFAHDDADEATRRNDIDEILHAAGRGATLTRKLLDFAHRHDAQPLGVADLAQVVTESLGMVDRLAGPRVRVASQIAPGPLAVALDATAIVQVLLNLVSNARDAMPAGGNLSIVVRGPEADASSRMASLAVTDSGTGIDAQTLARVFEPLFTTKPRGRGTGLGLSTSHMLVHRAGGSITVRSEVGRGTTFFVNVPLDTSTAAPVAASPSTAAPVAGGARCLLVEDEAALRQAYARALRATGFDVIEAASLSAARVALDAHGAALRLVVTDMMLFGESGVDVITHARAAAPNAACLAITGYFEGVSAHLDEGVDVLRKPFSARALADRAIYALQHRPKPSRAPSAAAVDARPLILVVDDSESSRALTCRYLAAVPARVEALPDGAAALSFLARERAALVLLDIDMPGIDGYETARRIRAERGPSAPPLVALTAFTGAAEARRCYEAGCDAYLAKPVRRDQLIEVVSSHLAELAAPSAADTEALDAGPDLSPIEADVACLVPPFLAACAADLVLLRDDVSAGDWSRVAVAGLNLKGVGASYGFPKISRIGVRLSACARRGDGPGATQSLDALESFLARVGAEPTMPILS